MTRVQIRYTIPILALIAATPAIGAGLKPETEAAWNQYMQKAHARMQQRLSGTGPYLWCDEQPKGRAGVRDGEVLIAPVNGKGYESVPNGLIHHWVGSVFVPDTNLSELLSVLGDYSRYKDFYPPTIVGAKLKRRDGDEDIFSVRSVHKILFVNLAMDTEYVSRSYRPDDTHYYTLAHSTNVREIHNYGEPDEFEVPMDESKGYLRRVASITRYEQADNGVYVELEVIGLTRDIPISLRFLIKPLVAKLSRNSLQKSLAQSREAVITTSKAARLEKSNLPKKATGAASSGGHE